MKKAALLIGIIFLMAACSPVSKQAKQDLAKPINCATAAGDIRALNSEKENVGREIAAGVTAIVPVGLVLNTATGNEGTNLKVATGEYNKMIDKKIAEIKQQYTIVMVTHNMQQAARVSDYTAFFLNGKLIEHDETNVIFTKPHDKKTEDYITGRFG